MNVFRSVAVVAMGLAVAALDCSLAAQSPPQRVVTKLPGKDMLVQFVDRNPEQNAQGQLMLRFQLIEASTQGFQARDPAIAAIDTVLRDLFRFNGYRLLSQAAIAMEMARSRGSGTGSSSRTAYQILSGPDGKLYDLHATLTHSWGPGPGNESMSVEVSLADGVPAVRDSAGNQLRPVRRTLLSTSVSVSPGRTVVIGSTQPAGPGSALILAVRPEIR